MTTDLLLSDDEFTAAMAEVLADPTNATTPGDAPDVISDDPQVLAGEGGGDDPNACRACGDAGAPGAPELTIQSFAAAASWRATWLADEFRRAGLVVVEVEGWRNRGVSFPNAPDVCLFHHTASNRNSGPAGGLRIVTYGRPGLDGPIANWLTARNGVIYVVAAGIANNAGTGNARAVGLPGVTGNSSTLADEMENDGIGEPYSPVQRTAAMKAHAAVHRRMGWPAGRAIGHNEWSTTGKIDPLLRTWGSMAACRASLATYINGTPQEDDVDPIKIAPDISVLTDGYLVAGRVEDPERFLQIIGWMAHRAQREATKATAQLGVLLAAAGAEVERDAADAVRDAELLAAVHAVQAGDPQAIAELLGPALTTKLLDALHARLAG